MKKALLNTASAACWISLCLAGGYLAASIAVDNTMFNTDSSAPYYQAKLITSGITANAKELSFARIPSIFPDLATLIALTKADHLARFHSVFARYAWIIASALIFLQAEFSRLTFSKSFSRLQSILASSTVTAGFAALSPQFRETLGLMLTPLHHGGNIINTYLMGCILLWRPSQSHIREPNYCGFKTLLLGATTLIGVASNKLFIFTAVLPYILTLLAASLAPGVLKIFFDLRAFPSKQLQKLALLFIAACIGLTITANINAQCSLPLVIRPLKTYNQLFTSIAGSYFNALGTALVLSLAAYSCYSLWRRSQGKQILESEMGREKALGQFYTGCLYLSLSTLSPFIYVFLLGEPGSLPIRYTLILGTGICGATIVFGCAAMYRTKVSKHPAWWNIFLRVAVATGAASLLAVFGLNNIKTNKTIEETFSDSFASRRPNIARVIPVLKKRGLTKGLSDFWGTEIAILSDLENSSAGRITVEPILPNGKPDFWSHNKHQFLDNDGKPKNFNFVISTNTEFERSITMAYGEASESKYFPEIDAKLLIYKNWSQRNKIRRAIKAKSKEFERQCDRSMRNFMER